LAFGSGAGSCASGSDSVSGQGSIHLFSDGSLSDQGIFIKINNTSLLPDMNEDLPSGTELQWSVEGKGFKGLLFRVDPGDEGKVVSLTTTSEFLQSSTNCGAFPGVKAITHLGPTMKTIAEGTVTFDSPGAVTIDVTVVVANSSLFAYSGFKVNVVVAPTPSPAKAPIKPPTKAPNAATKAPNAPTKAPTASTKAPTASTKAPQAAVTPAPKLAETPTPATTIITLAPTDIPIAVVPVTEPSVSEPPADVTEPPVEVPIATEPPVDEAPDETPPPVETMPATEPPLEPGTSPPDTGATEPPTEGEEVEGECPEAEGKGKSKKGMKEGKGKGGKGADSEGKGKGGKGDSEGKGKDSGESKKGKGKKKKCKKGTITLANTGSSKLQPHNKITPYSVS
jgi:hypothetical protein